MRYGKIIRTLRSTLALGLALLTALALCPVSAFADTNFPNNPYGRVFDPSQAIPSEPQNWYMAQNDGTVTATAYQYANEWYMGVIEANNGLIQENLGTVKVNNAPGNIVINQNGGTVTQNGGLMGINAPGGTVGRNEKPGIIEYNLGLILQPNEGTINNNYTAILDNYGTIKNNYASVGNNYWSGVIENNDSATLNGLNFDGIVVTNTGVIKNNGAGGIVLSNQGGGVIEKNYGSLGGVITVPGAPGLPDSVVVVPSQNYAKIIENYGKFDVNNGQVDTNKADGTIATNVGKVGINDGTVTTNFGTGYIAVNNGTVENNLSYFDGNGNLVFGARIGQNFGTIINNYGLLGDPNGSNSPYGPSGNNGKIINNNWDFEVNEEGAEVFYNFAKIKTNDGMIWNNLETGEITDGKGHIYNNFGGLAPKNMIENDYTRIGFHLDNAEGVGSMTRLADGNLIEAPNPAPSDVISDGTTLWSLLNGAYNFIKFAVTTVKDFVLEKSGVSLTGAEAEIDVSEQGMAAGGGRNYEVSLNGLENVSGGIEIGVRLTYKPEPRNDAAKWPSSPVTGGPVTGDPVPVVSSGPVKVSFDPAGGSFPGGSDAYVMDVVPGAAAVFPPDPVRKGFRFARWDCSDPTVGIDRENGVFCTYCPLSFTAVWEEA